MLGASDPRWDELRRAILDYYEHHSLDETMEMMRRDYNFHASERQYRTKLAEWGAGKHVRGRDMLIMIGVLQRRATEHGKQTQFICRGKAVPMKKIRRFMKRKNITAIPDDSGGAVPGHIKFSTPEPLEAGPSRWSSVLPETNSAPSPASTDGVATPMVEPEEITLLLLNHDDMTVLNEVHDLAQPVLWSDSLYQDDFYDSGPLLPVNVETMESGPLFQGQSRRLDGAIISNDDLDVICNLRNICDSSLESPYFVSCLDWASKYANPDVFRFLVLDALNIERDGHCSTTLLEKAQEHLHNLALSLLQRGALEHFAFLFRCRIVKPEFARHVTLQYGLLNSNARLLSYFLGRDEVCAAFDLDAILERAASIRDSMDCYGPDAARAVIHAAFGAGLVSPNGVTALHVATALLLYDDVARLLDAGADVNQQMGSGEGALHILARMTECKVMPMTRLLIAHGASVDLQDERGDTCLHWLFRGAQKPWSLVFAQFLLSNGADLNLVNCQGHSWLWVAISTWPGQSVLQDWAGHRVASKTGRPVRRWVAWIWG